MKCFAVCSRPLYCGCWLADSLASWLTGWLAFLLFLLVLLGDCLLQAGFVVTCALPVAFAPVEARPKPWACCRRWPPAQRSQGVQDTCADSTSQGRDWFGGRLIHKYNEDFPGAPKRKAGWQRVPATQDVQPPDTNRQPLTVPPKSHPV